MSVDQQTQLIALLNSTQDRVCSRDLEGALIFWNKAFGDSIKENFNVEPRIGLKTVELIPSDQMEKISYIRDEYLKVYKGENVKVEYEFPSPDGKIGYFESSWSPILENGEVIAVAEITRDVTERKRLGKEIETFSERMRVFVKESQLVIYSLHLEQPMPVDNSLSEDDKIKHLFNYAYIDEANDAWAHMIGYEKGGDLIGLRLRDFLSPDEPESIKSLQAFIRSGYCSKNIETFETYPTGKNMYNLNNTFSVIKDGKLLSFWGTAIDITDFKMAEKKLREAESKYRTVADFTYNWEWWEDPDGEYLYMSPSCERITGYKQEEFINKQRLFDELILPEDRKEWKEHRKNVQCERKLRGIQFRIKRKDGVIRWIEHASQPANDNEGKFLGFRASNRDITEHKQAQEELHQIRQELIHATRTTTMGEFTAALAHEINHPLGSILANAQAAQRFLQKENPDLKEIQAIITDIIAEDRRASDVIKKLRALMKKSEPNFEPLKINAVVNETLSLIHSELIIQNINLKKELRSDLPVVLGDRIQIQQVILNIIINAIDAMKKSKKKELIITTDIGKCPRDNVMISIKDSGSGFSENIKKILFEPFFTTKDEGMGMGLAVNQSIIKAHNGEICAENNADRGARFCIYFPAYREENS